MQIEHLKQFSSGIADICDLALAKKKNSNFHQLKSNTTFSKSRAFSLPDSGRHSVWKSPEISHDLRDFFGGMQEEALL